MRRGAPRHLLYLLLQPRSGLTVRLARETHARRGLLHQLITAQESETEGKVILADIFALERNDHALEEVVARMCIEPDVSAVSWKRTTA